MSDLIAENTYEADEEPTRQRSWLPLILGLAALALAIMAVVAMESGRPPGDTSLEAGFARDMMK